MDNEQHQEAKVNNRIIEQTKVNNRLLFTLTAKLKSDSNQLSSLEDSENSGWIENFNRIATQKVWDTKKQVDVVSLYLRIQH